MDKKLLRNLQLTELEILRVIDDFCDKYKINYSLYAGTALGAVRHKGFIPWDDDIDIIMTRNEYEKFYNAWGKKKIEGYYLQSPDYINCKSFNINHCKIKKDNTILLSEGEELEEHNGVWVDIFILDKIKNQFYSKFYIYVWGILRIIFSRNRIGIQTNNLIKSIFKTCNRIPRKIKQKILMKSNKKITKYRNIKEDYIWVDLSTVSTFNIHFPKTLTEEFEEIQFENYKFKIFKDYNTLLELEYGDYMKLPPIEDRVCKHNPIYIQL